LKKRTSINSIPKIHKEKEMADFRKLLYALPAVALVACFTGSASAQSLNCITATSNYETVRMEGWTELVGDIVLACTNTNIAYTGSAPGTPIQPADIAVQLPTNVTSKILNPGASQQVSEATLMIDDLKNPATGVNFNRLLCSNSDIGGVLGTCAVTSNGNADNTYNGSNSHPNMFVGRPGTYTPNTIVFSAVPLDPPATGLTRYIRITNIRANATTFAVGSTITALISFQNTTAVLTNNITVNVGYVQKGLGPTVVTADNSYLQCEYPLNPEDKEGSTENHGFCTTGSGSYTVSGASCSGGPAKQLAINVSENIQTGFKPRNQSEMNANSFGGTGLVYNDSSFPSLNPGDIAQDSVQSHPFTEGGFSENQAGSGGCFTSSPNNISCNQTTGGAIPYFLTLGTTYPNGALGGGAGTADWGTRLQLTVTSIPSGTVVSFPTVVFLNFGGVTTGVMVMTNTTTPNGKGPYTPTPAVSGLAGLQAGVHVKVPEGGTVSVPYFDLTGPGPQSITYEVLYASSGAIETATIYPIVYYPAKTLPTSIVNNLPQANTFATVTAATYAPYYSATGDQYSVPPGQVDGTPRFTQSSYPGSPYNLFSLSRCTCSLLFPWVVSDGSYTTGIVVANTSKDPTNGLTPPVIGYTAVQSQGTVQLYLFGTIAGKTAQTLTTIAATYPGTDTLALPGSYATFIVNTGFDGYAITQANFQYCHGLAFLFNGNGSVPPVSYLGLVMDEGSQLGRTVQPTTDALEN
jgi:hypothetical protein